MIEAGADVNYPNYDDAQKTSSENYPDHNHTRETWKTQNFDLYAITKQMQSMAIIHPSPRKKEQNTALMLASRNGHEKCVEMLLEAGANVNKSNADGVTDLMYAAITGYVNCIRKLLEVGADVNKAQDDIIDCDGLTPLMSVARTGNEKCLDVLIQAGADVNKSVQGYTAIACAVDEDNGNCVEKLINVGAEANSLNMYFETLLITASRCGLVKVMKLLLKAGADVNMAGAIGETALMAAAKCGAEQCLKLLIESGADVNKFNMDSESAVMMAANSGTEKCLKLLIEAGADLDDTDCRQKTALMHAVENKNEQCAATLIKAGADVNLRNEYGDTAIICAINEESEQCVELLLQEGVDPNLENSNQKSLLSMAVLHQTGIKPLLDAGADVKTIENGVADLISFGKLSDVELLINAGVDVNSSDESVLRLGAMKENIKFVKLLLRASARVNITNYLGYSALEEYIGQNGRVKYSRKEHPTSAKKRMCMMLLAAGEDCKETTVPYVDREGYPCDMIKTPEYLLESEFSLKNKCREAIRNHLLELDQYTNLFKKIPHLGLPSSIQRYLLYGFSLDDAADKTLYVDEGESSESSVAAMIKMTNIIGDSLIESWVFFSICYSEVSL